MKTCMVYGNCHIRPIRKYLMASPSFQASYEMVEVPPVHECDRETGLGQELLRTCDLFIYQRVKDSFGPFLSTDYLLQQLPESCIRISFGNAYFGAFYPHLSTDPTFPYGDSNVLRFIQEGKSKQEILALLTDEHFYSYDEVQAAASASIEELRRRELAIDIPIADYIAEHYRSLPLFCTHNHPTHYIFRYLAKQMLAALDLPKGEIESVIWDDFSDQTHPIYPSIIKHLGLHFFPEHTYRIGGQALTFEEYIGAYIDHLSG